MPTSWQLPSGRIVNGEELWEMLGGAHERRPTGKCPNCGDPCFGGRYCCSNECDREYIAYVASEVTRR